MYISLSTHIFVYHEFIGQFLDIVSDCNVETLEIFAVNPHFPYRDARFVSRILNLCQRKKIKIKSVHFPLYFHIDDIKEKKWLSLSAENEDLRMASIRETAAASQILATSNGGILVVHTSIPGGEFGGKKIFLFIDSMKRLMEEIPENVKIAIENTTNSSGTAQVTAQLAESFTEDRVGVCIDIGHANVIESPAFAVIAAKKRLINIHVSDNFGDRDEHLPLGEGNINWRKIVKTLQSIHYRGPITLEIRDPLKGGNVDLHLFRNIIAKSVNNLQDLIEGIEFESRSSS